VTSILPLITGSAGAVVVLALGCYLFFAGKLHSDAEFQKLAKENDDLKAALESERRALNDAASTGTVTNRLISALIQVSAQRDSEHDHHAGHPRAAERTRDLTGEDLGL
jgi:hypothetical protein